MAASSVNAVRVRLHFDYPPPFMPDCRMSWVLVDLNKCRVVADLCCVIREKFDYSRKTCLDLFIEDCFLPPAESIYVVRDNDSIRVKVSSVSCEHAGKKRVRDEEGSFQTAAKKNRSEASEADGFPQPVGAKKKKRKHKAKKKKTEEQQVACGDVFNAAVPAKENLSTKSQTDKSSKKAASSLTNGKASLSGVCDKSSDSSDSSEEVSQNPSPSKSKRTQVAESDHPVTRKSSSEKVPVKKSSKPNTSFKAHTNTKTPKEQTSSVPAKSATNSAAAKKTQTETSSESSSSEDEASAANGKVNILAKSTPVQQKSVNTASSSSSEEDEDDSRKGKKSSVQQKILNSSKSVSLLQTQPPPYDRKGEASKTSSSKKPSGNPKKSKMQTSSEDEAAKVNVPATPKLIKPAPDSCAVVENGASRTPSTPVRTMLQDNKDKEASSDSSSSSDIELVIKKPNPQLMIGLTPRGRGRGFTDRVKGRGGVRGGFGRARGTPWKQNFHHNYDDEEQRKEKVIQTNKSILLQNPPEPSPRLDYGTLPLLAAPPAVGQKIVFKLLELTENYTPEVSEYKEGKIIGFNHSTNMIELELLTQNQARTEPGKFDLVYMNPDGSETVEYAVTLGSQMTERWESLIEPRLILPNTN